MASRDKRACAGPPRVEAPCCCKVEAIVTVDERGQMVLPKELRTAAGIAAGERLAVVTWRQGGSVCCIGMVKADELAGMVKNLLGPMMAELGTPKEHQR